MTVQYDSDVNGRTYERRTIIVFSRRRDPRERKTLTRRQILQHEPEHLVRPVLDLDGEVFHDPFFPSFAFEVKSTGPRKVHRILKPSLVRLVR